MSDIADARDLSRRLILAVVTPMIVLIVLGVVLLNQTVRMRETAAWVDHTDEVIAKAHELESSIADQETAVRGYLLTDDASNLAAYRNAHPRERLDELKNLVSDNPPQVARVVELRAAYDGWAREVDSSLTSPDSMRTLTAFTLRKVAMDGMRKSVAAFLDIEDGLRKVRAQESAASASATRWLTISLFGGSALALAFFSRRHLAVIAGRFGEALEKERDLRRSTEDEAWVRSAQSSVLTAAQGDLDVGQIAEAVLRELAHHTGADAGALFVRREKSWHREAGLALPESAPATFEAGESLIGRSAENDDIVVVRDVPAGHMTIRSATGASEPVTLVIASARAEMHPEAVIELAFLGKPPERALDLIRRVRDGIGLVTRAAAYRRRLQGLLEESRTNAEELQAQQEELRTTNEELDHQSQVLRDAQSGLEERQAELEAINAQLEERTVQLERADIATRDKSVELERASRYKSEFLANMSHELRTPLNSTLILAKLLIDNKSGNLTAEQVEYARTIHSSGHELLTLINDVLDLSKVEAGKVDIEYAKVALRELAVGLERQFDPIAKQKGLDFRVNVLSSVPDFVETDGSRLNQVLRNLLANAFKFTLKGSVDLTISGVGTDVHFTVRDTGIGIAPEHHGTIFEAFRQADGTTNRKFGGTGLGLSISRDLTRMLGGKISVASTLEHGSAFTVALPTVPPRQEELAPETPPKAEGTVPPSLVADDRDSLDPTRRAVLVIEDDVHFAKILVDLAHELGFQCIAAHEAAHGLALAKLHTPHAILLDMKLPDRSGLWVLDQLKRTPQLRHVPVHVISIADHQQTVLSLGAAGYLQKPVDRTKLTSAFKAIEASLAQRVRRLLIVDSGAGADLQQLLGGEGVEVVVVDNVKAAFAALDGSVFESVVLDLTRPDAPGMELLTSDRKSIPPVIVYSERALTAAEEKTVRDATSSLVVKGVRSRERLLDEATLFLHQVEAKLPPERRKMLEQARSRDSVFDGRKVLLAEDDVRNIFALSRILEPRGIKLSVARNGREALDMIERDPGIEMVLMDIMMPEMDGLTAIRSLRQKPRWKSAPIIALTAKAMRDDRERCLDAGANDYIAKPIDPDVLLSLMRVWMPK